MLDLRVLEENQIFYKNQVSQKLDLLEDKFRELFSQKSNQFEIEVILTILENIIVEKNLDSQILEYFKNLTKSNTL